MIYLLHAQRNGHILGVLSEDNDFYPAKNQDARGYGIAVVRERPEAISWEDWVDDLSGKVPGPRNRFIDFESKSYSLEKVFAEAAGLNS